MSGNENGHRWSKWWWQDHQSDAALRACGLAARGYWVEMLAVMHKACPVGHLLLNTRSPTHRQMAAIAGCTEKEAKACEVELEEAGVFSRTPEGTIYCRRMVKDAAASEAGREHIAKRWNTAKPTQPPNSPPSRGPTSKPNGDASSHPTSQAYRPPNPPEAKKQKEEAEEKEGKVKILTSSLSPASVLARVAAACEAPPAGTYGANEPTQEPPSEATAVAVRTITGKVARKLESTGMRPAVKYAAHTVREQIIACKPIPKTPEIPAGLETAVINARKALANRATENLRATLRIAA